MHQKQPPPKVACSSSPRFGFSGSDVVSLVSEGFAADASDPAGADSLDCSAPRPSFGDASAPTGADSPDRSAPRASLVALGSWASAARAARRISNVAINLLETWRLMVTSPFRPLAGAG